LLCFQADGSDAMINIIPENKFNAKALKGVIEEGKT
jgi:hypothetical protein